MYTERIAFPALYTAFSQYFAPTSQKTIHANPGYGEIGTCMIMR
jgi:hypothetical protein